jgi:hypothetical protein
MTRASRQRSAGTAAWLQTDPSIEELVEAHPEEWDRVQRDLEELLARDDQDEIKSYVTEVSQPQETLPGRARPLQDRLNAEIRRRMSVHLLKQAILSSTTGVTEGRVRFGLLAGSVAQRLLFHHGLDRKPVSLAAFRLIWPLLGRQRRLLMPLVQPKGIWCFYSAQLIRRLAGIIGDRSCLEIAAGDGTLARFLSDAGAPTTATDDYSWSSIDFPETVLKQDARTALRAHRPQVVVCSWPPANNAFEKYVFTTADVEQYIVIGSRHESSTGNWAAYRAQTDFAMHLDEDLSSLVVPPEVEHAVYVFTRSGTPSAR